MKPDLSIIITCYNAEKTILSCLNSIYQQVTDKEFEVIVIDSSTDGTAQRIIKNYPEVRLYRFSERKFCGCGRNIGISYAKADIIAFTDADCEVDSSWIDQIMIAHNSSDFVIGGAIKNTAKHSLVGWAAYFCEFSHLMPDGNSAYIDDVAGANMSYKSNVFDKFGLFIEGTYCSDTDFHWRLLKKGHQPRFCPSIIVSHNSITNFITLIRHEFQHGRYFGIVRSQKKLWLKVRRFLYSMLFFLIPLKLYFEILLRNLKNRIYLRSFLKASPLLIIVLFSWCMGEAFGYAGRIDK